MAGGAAAGGPGNGGQSQIASAVQQSLGLPNRTKLLGPSVMMGLNQTDARPWIDDKEFFYIQNMIRLGNGRYRAMYDAGPAFFTAPPNKTIVSFFWFNIGATYYCAVFYKDGTADQVDLNGIVTPISSVAANFYHGSGHPLPACCQSGSNFLIIANNDSNNDYWLWDGKLLYTAGSIGPDINIIDGGAGYSSPPAVTAFGGSGSGISITAVVSGGSVIALNINNPGMGYQPTDQVQLVFTGGGTDDGIELTASIAGGGVSAIQVTNPGSGYVTAPTVTITPGPATAIAILGTGSQAGQVIAVQITNPGSGYAATPTVSFSSGSAAALALLNGGAVTAVNVINGGTNLTGTPLLTIVGGGGTGATATASISGGTITGVTVTNGGSGYTTVPAVRAQTALNNAAAATIELMPFGVSGTAVEVFTARVFVGPPFQQGPQPTGADFFVSAPGSLTNFATSAGGLLFSTTDRFLRVSYTNFRQSNGYLYPFGDSSISVISNVQTSGQPVQTSFTYQNTDPQIGTQWRDTCQDFSRTIVFANILGAWGLYGGAVTKISGKLDRIFENAILPTAPFPTVGQPLVPTSAVCTIHNMKCYVLLITITNPITKQPQVSFLVWNEQHWTIATTMTEADFIYIGSREIASDLTAWGTDGFHVHQLFAQPNPELPKVMATKMFGIDQSLVTKQMLAEYLVAVDLTGDGLSFDLTLENESGGWAVPADQSFINWSDFIAQQSGTPPPISPSPDEPLLATRGLDVVGQLIGWTLSTTAADFEIYSTTAATLEVGAVYG